MMRILILADGSSSHTEKWVEELLKDDLTIFLFSLRAFSKKMHQLSENENLELFTPKLTIDSNASFFKKSTYLKIIPSLKSKIKKFQPDLIHAHYISSYGLLAFLSGFRPYLLSVWGSDIMVFPKRSPIHQLLIKLILKNASQVFATSKLMENLVVDNFKQTQCKQIAFGIDTARFKPIEAVKQTKPFRFIILKSLTPTYGIDIAIEAFQLLKMKYPNDQLELNIYGDGANQAEYEHLAGILLDSSIFFKGRIPNSEAPKVLQEANVFINISRNESFGVSVLEASAAGLPVIVSNRGGLPETMVHDSTGILLKELTAQACSEAMEKYFKNPELTEEHGKNGRLFVVNNFRQEDLTKLQLESYKKLIKEV